MMLHALARHVYCTIILPLSAMFTAMIKELVFGFEIDGYTWWEMDHECAILVVTPQQPLSCAAPPRRTYDDVALPPSPTTWPPRHATRDSTKQLNER